MCILWVELLNSMARKYVVLECREKFWSDLICYKRLFQVSFEATSSQFFSSLLWITGFLFSIFNDNVIWGNSALTHIGLANCSIKANLHQKKHWFNILNVKNKSWFLMVLKEVAWRFKNHHIQKNIDHENKGQFQNPNSPLCFHIIFNFNIFSTLNCCSEREIMHDEKLIVQHFNN